MLLEIEKVINTWDFHILASLTSIAGPGAKLWFPFLNGTFILATIGTGVALDDDEAIWLINIWEKIWSVEGFWVCFCCKKNGSGVFFSFPKISLRSCEGEERKGKKGFILSEERERKIFEL